MKTTVKLFGLIATVAVMGLMMAACDDGSGTTAHTHNWGEWSVTKAATCTEAGTKERVCALDATHKETDAIPALGHEWGDWVQTTAPTCTTAGIKTRACTHEPTHIDPVTQTGDPIDTDAHDWEWIVTTPASILAEGVETSTCRNDSSHTNGTRTIDKIEEITSSNGISMMQISAGTFTMGSPDDEPDRSDTETQHSVTLTQGFYMGKYQVTQEQYQAVMGTNPSYFQGGTNRTPAAGEVQGKRPVENVRWYDALVFCNKLSVMEGLTPAYSINGSTDTTTWGTVPTTTNATWNAVTVVADSTGYRLPTEAQWEYACRAGTTTTYNTGATISNDTGWYYGNSGSKTHEVGKKPPNDWGLYDMHGNVFEWCWDWYNANYYSEASAGNDPTGAVSGTYRVERGGSWDFDGWSPRSAYRSGREPSYRGNRYGFRLVRP